MQAYIGKSVCSGVAIGKVNTFYKNESKVMRLKVEDTDTEIVRYQRAMEIAKKQLQELYAKAVESVGEENAAVFEVHQMMLEDEDYCESIANIIRTERVNAEYAVAVTGDNFAQMFACMEDEYMNARELAKEVDFFSVGTNDLTQYTLAIDRQNPKLDAICDTHHPAILALISMTIKNAHAEGKWVGICGELGADITMTETFLRMGVDELSMSPGMILRIRQKILKTDVSKLPLLEF